MYESIIAVLSLLVGASFVYLFGFRSIKSRYESELFEYKELYEAERQNSSEQGSKNAAFAEKVRGLELQNIRLEELIKEGNEAKSRVIQLETLLDKEREYTREKLQLLEENKERMKLEFKELADNILKTNSEKFSTQNNENLTKMITPIKEQFDAFKKQIHDVYIKETQERSMLQSEIKAIKEINHQMSNDAKSHACTQRRE